MTHSPAAVPETIECAPDALFQSALELIAADDPAGAAEAFRQVLAADPGHIEAHHGLIRALRDAGDVEAAITAARALTALTPEDPLAQTSLSIALQQAGYIPEAEAAGGRARILEWKRQLAEPSSPGSSSTGGEPIG